MAKLEVKSQPHSVKYSSIRAVRVDEVSEAERLPAECEHISVGFHLPLKFYREISKLKSLQDS